MYAIHDRSNKMHMKNEPKQAKQYHELNMQRSLKLLNGERPLKRLEDSVCRRRRHAGKSTKKKPPPSLGKQF